MGFVGEGRQGYGGFCYGRGRTRTGSKRSSEIDLCIETTDGGPGTEIRAIHEQLSYLSPSTIFIAMEEEEIIFWLCQKGKNIELRRKQIKSPKDIITFLQSVMQIARQKIGDENIPLLFLAHGWLNGKRFFMTRPDFSVNS